MPDVTREEFEQLRESHTQTRERVAANEAVQEQHGGAIQRLSDQVSALSRETRQGFATVTQQITEENSLRARTVSAAIASGSAVGSASAVGLYQLLHTLYPHLFGG
ncbi:hypothetical protein AA15669_1795 [Saccharibacter floricola DSM 15669]|uniref:Uncharacterized protein n=1 Tax=Saccharibacter floricola DSM 15669 TaxID=1123227 RepID=A0ABQ0P0S5_9PROT|nr:hypothetical protein [Saccharibacter floricola]GBQ08468.1 hypothetical protein AA15669_1795 [Saccharibacter floricola DSM 15669]